MAGMADPSVARSGQHGRMSEQGRLRLPPRGGRRPLAGRLRPGLCRREGPDLRPVRAPMPPPSSPSTASRIERVMTDNAMNYRRSKDFRATLDELGIAHQRTRNYRPQTNGKAERFNRTLLEEFAYKDLFTSSNEARSAALEPWVDSYNADQTSHGHRRAHPAPASQSTTLTGITASCCRSRRGRPGAGSRSRRPDPGRRCRWSAVHR